LRGLRVPRTPVLLCAALVIFAPAGFVLAGPYITGDYGVKHQDVDRYRVLNQITGDDQLKAKAEAARFEWSDRLANRGTITLPQATSDHEVKLTRTWEDTNVRVAWKPQTWHAGPVTVTFNSKFTNGMTGDAKQGQACNVLGNVLGIDDSTTSGDCMQEPGQQVLPKDASLDLVDEFYGPNLALSGSLIKTLDSPLASGAPRNKLEQSSAAARVPYSLTATATGHSLTQVKVVADPGQANERILAQASAPAPCDNSCTATASIAGKTTSELGLDLGLHTLAFQATNKFGRTTTVTRAIEVVGYQPNFACPSWGTRAEGLATLLTGPDDGGYYDDSRESAEPLPAPGDIRYRPAPNRNLRLIVRAPDELPRAGESEAPGALAAAAARTSAVNLGGLRWCVIQPTSDPESIDFSKLDALLQSYLRQGVGVRSIKLIDPPDWAIGEGCVQEARNEFVDRCPPLEVRESDLRVFARTAAERYGPSNPAPLPNGGYDVEHLAFWNEPNKPENWGANDPPPGSQQVRAQAYADRLNVFSNGAKSGDAAIKIDAGEIAAGSCATGCSNPNGVNLWTREFVAYNNSRYGDGDASHPDPNYDVLTIHAYSEQPWQIPRKVNSYGAKRGVADRVAITEFGWALSTDASQAESWKCVFRDADQAAYLEASMRGLMAAGAPELRSIAWFNLIDAHKQGSSPATGTGGGGPPCPDPAYYNGTWSSGQGSFPAGNVTNTYGLFRRDPDGKVPSAVDASPADGQADWLQDTTHPRSTLLTEFKCWATSTSC
jgi:hypothetical protein